VSRFVLALDQGTTSSRAILFDRAGAVVAVDQHEFPQHFPRPGWVQHDPEQIWQSQLRAARGALARAGAAGSDVAAIGITNQRETTLVWDRASGEAVHPAIVWQSRQTAPLCAELRARGLEDEVRRRTGLVIDAYFSATKIRFILDAIPDGQRRAERGELAFGTVDSWLVHRLTRGRVHATEYSNASRTMVFDIHRRDWDDLLLGELRLPRALLPEVRDSSGVIGVADREWLGAEIPIAGMAGDQQAALFGQGCLRAGQAKNTYGTGCFLLMNTGERAPVSKSGLVTTIGWGIGGRVEYALEGSVFVTGSAVQWLRDGLGLIRDAAETEALASSVPDSGGVYLVPAFVGLGAPYWGPGGAHPGHHARPRRARHARGDRVPDAGRGRVPARRLGPRARGAPGRRRRGAQRLPDAAPGRPARRPGRAPGAARGDREGRRRPRRPRRRLLAPRRGGPERRGAARLRAAPRAGAARGPVRGLEARRRARARLGGGGMSKAAERPRSEPQASEVRAPA
jgi:glycerol kinase